MGLLAFPFLFVVSLIRPQCPIKSKGRSFAAARNPCWLKFALTRRMSLAANRGTHTRAAATSARLLPIEAGQARQQQFPFALAIHRIVSIPQIILATANPAGSAASSRAPPPTAILPLPRDSRQRVPPAPPTRETPPAACNGDNRAVRCFPLTGDPRRDVRRSVVGGQYIALLSAKCCPH